MTRNAVSGLVLMLLFTSMFTSVFIIQPVKAADGTIYIRVDGSVDPLTAPILNVGNSYYTFTADVYGSIVIERDNIVVDGAGHVLQGTGRRGIDLSYRISVTVKNIRISTWAVGIYLDYSSYNMIVGNNIAHVGDGIDVHYSSYNTIVENVMTDVGAGIYLWERSNYNIVSKNDITDTTWGIYLYESSSNTLYANHVTTYNQGIQIEYSSHNTVSKNDITTNYLGVNLYESSSNTVVGNTIANSEVGVYFYHSFDNTLSGNNIVNNDWGIVLMSWWREPSSDNLIYHNNLIDNVLQVEDWAPPSINVWDNNYPSGGNYWSDYAGVDANNDGIGDTPYVIDAYNRDRYPLMNPCTITPPPPPPYPLLPPPTKFKSGDQVRTTTSVNVREGPGLDHDKIDAVPEGTSAQIMGGRVEADGHVWWNVNYDVGVRGWSAEDWLELSLDAHATVYIDPSTIATAPGETFTVNIMASNVHNLWAWQAGLQWDPTVLEFVSFAEGDLETLVEFSTGLLPFGADQVTGSLYPPFTETILSTESGALTPVSAASLKLFSVTFKAINSGTSSLSLIDVVLKGQDPTTTTAYAGWGDVDGDLKVNIVDLSFLGLSWFRGMGDLGYDHRADHTGDGFIDVSDLAITSSNWGKVWDGEGNPPETPTLYDIPITLEDSSVVCTHDEPLENHYVITTVGDLRVRAYLEDQMTETWDNVIITLPLGSLLRKVEHPDNGKIVDGYPYPWQYVMLGTTWREDTKYIMGWVAENYLMDYTFPEEPKEINTRLTAYNVVKETEMKDRIESGEWQYDEKFNPKGDATIVVKVYSFTWEYLRKEPRTYNRAFLYSDRGVSMQGSGRDSSGRLIKGEGSYTWIDGWIDDETKIEFYELLDCPFQRERALDSSKGSKGYVFPWRSVAVDAGGSVPLNSIVYIPELAGEELSNGAVLDGYFVAQDKGKFENPNWIDLFVGTGQMALEDHNRIVGSRQFTVQYHENPSTIQVKQNSPGELRVYDSMDRVTGVVDGEIKTEIPYSNYDCVDNAITIFFAAESYRYTTIGTDEGFYGLTVTNITGYETTTFTATNIPISPSAIHQYAVDWEVLSLGDEGVTVQIDSDDDGVFEHAFTSDSELTLNEYVVGTDETRPETWLTVGEPKFPTSDLTYLTSATPIELITEDNPGGSGVASTAYRVSNATYDCGWTTYTEPFYLVWLSDGAYQIDYNSTDVAGNVELSSTVTVILDNTGPSVTAENPPAGWALQDGVTFIIAAIDASGTSSMNLSIREADGGEGTPVGFEDLPTVYDAATGKWTLFFDTLQLPDGYYIVIVNAEDNLGHTSATIVAYSIRNWAVLELLPASENNKAGRTMPIKFALRVAAAVDPLQPFVYNEDLTIDVYATDTPDAILQESTFGDDAQDYRINSLTEVYITNFKTLRTPQEYRVDVYRNDLLIDSFMFETVK